MSSLPDGFTWTGSLDETDIRSLYAACHSLRFSGRLQLKDGPQKAEVLFVAGEPIEIDGGDTQRIALWARGTFCAVQAIPSLHGELTAHREVSGSLAETKPSMLWAWISEYRLTCEIELERPGSKALVAFSNGHAENAQVNGLPELAALARVSSGNEFNRLGLTPELTVGAVAAIGVFLWAHSADLGRPSALAAAFDPEPVRAYFTLAREEHRCLLQGLGWYVGLAEKPTGCDPASMLADHRGKDNIFGKVADAMPEVGQSSSGVTTRADGTFSSVAPPLL